MSREELKKWAKEKVKNKFWLVLAVLLVSGLITNLSFYDFNTDVNGKITATGFSLGWLFFFVEVGTTYFMVNYINDKEVEFKDIFKFSSDFVRCLVVSLLEMLYIFLYTLLLIVPGIMKAYSYSLVPYLLADEKYKELKASEILKKSEEMMNGHRMDLFVLQLSFCGWLLLGIITCGLALIYVTPYMRTTITKYLYDLKVKCEN